MLGRLDNLRHPINFEGTEGTFFIFSLLSVAFFAADNCPSMGALTVVVDVLYITDLFGAKTTSATRQSASSARSAVPAERAGQRRGIARCCRLGESIRDGTSRKSEPVVCDPRK
jgi:hypothetical protein